MSNTTIDKRIELLEKKVLSPPGTILSRVLTEKGPQWSLGIGQLQMPKQFFTGDSIDDVVMQAEQHFKVPCDHPGCSSHICGTQWSIAIGNSGLSREVQGKS